MIDGARFFRIFLRILLPNSVPIITVTVIWQFTNIWNDFLFGASFTTGSSAPDHRGAEQHRQYVDRRQGIQRPHGHGHDRRAADAARLCRRWSILRTRSDGRFGQGVNHVFSAHHPTYAKPTARPRSCRRSTSTSSDGEFLVLVGPSGCGKSTLLSLIAGLDTLTSGEIRIDGDKVNDLSSERARHRDGVPELCAVSEHDRRRRTSASVWRCARSRRPSARRPCKTRAKLLQIEHLLDRRPGQLSGGQRQRVAMGRALVRDPKIFLFDEPLSNLDAKLRVDMRTEIKKLHQRLGATIVYVTHDQIEAMTLATRIAVMKGGVLQQLGTPAEVYNTPGQHVRRDLHGLAVDEPDSRAHRAREWRASPESGRRPEGNRSGVAAATGCRRALRRQDGARGAAPRSDRRRERARRIGVAHRAGHDQSSSNRLAPTRLPCSNSAGWRCPRGSAPTCRTRPANKCELRVDLSKLVLFDADTEIRIH